MGLLAVAFAVIYFSLANGKRHPREHCFSAQLAETAMLGGAIFLGLLIFFGLSLWYVAFGVGSFWPTLGVLMKGVLLQVSGVAENSEQIQKGGVG